MKQFFRITAALLAAAFLLALTGCGSSSSAPSFTWFVDTIPANLDPQVASAAPDVIACENLYSGLVRKKADGEIVPDLSESWTISSDGKTYTFQIKDGLTYKAVKGASTDHTITAEDFVFAFRRIFQPQTNSPYAVEFAALENSAAVLAGTADASTLGVSAADPLTLVFRLSEKDDNFLAKLTLPGAMPCDEAFFESTRGTYGLTAKTTLSSGSFYLYNWTASGLFLHRDVSSPMIGSLRLVQNTGSTGKSAAQLIADEKCSAALDDTGEDTSLQSVDYSDTTWHCCSTAPKILCLPIRNCGRRLPASPGRMWMCPLPVCTPLPRALCPPAFPWTASITASLPGTRCHHHRPPYIVSECTAGHGQLGFFRRDHPAAEGSRPDRTGRADQRRMAEGLLPFLLGGRGSAGGVRQTPCSGQLHHCVGSHPRRRRQRIPDVAAVHGRGRRPDRLVRPHLLSASGRECPADRQRRCALLADCERQLLEGCAVVPLLGQNRRLLVADGITGLVFDPFTPVLDLTDAQKN